MHIESSSEVFVDIQVRSLLVIFFAVISRRLKLDDPVLKALSHKLFSFF
jgi:hypothetical protein